MKLKTHTPQYFGICVFLSKFTLPFPAGGQKNFIYDSII